VDSSRVSISDLVKSSRAEVQVSALAGRALVLNLDLYTSSGSVYSGNSTAVGVTVGVASGISSPLWSVQSGNHVVGSGCGTASAKSGSKVGSVTREAVEERLFDGAILRDGYSLDCECAEDNEEYDLLESPSRYLSLQPT